ncbi:MAG: glycosyltransferase family 2 protein [Alphaproteobacteria bacterium]|nr:glycosyltransferase family 2 protein [Alphaproteobacteria bacterium]
MRHGQSIAVVIPTLNEEQAIARVIGDIPHWVDKVIVADNASQDGTRSVARALGADVVVEPDRGYGAACQRGIAASDAYDIIVFLDGDYSDYPQDMARLVDPIAANDADLVIGSRVNASRNNGSLTVQQRFGNWLACTLIRHLFGVAFTDLGPFRAIRADALSSLNMQDRAYGWTVEMQIRAAKAGLRIKELPVRYRARIGVSKISGTLSGSVRAGATILRIIGRSALQPQ